MNWKKLALALFARNRQSGATEQVDMTDDARNALHVEDQHDQPLTDAQLRQSPVGAAAWPEVVEALANQTVGDESVEIVGSGEDLRLVRLWVDARVEHGIHVNVGAAAALGHPYLPPGQGLVLTTSQAIHAISASEDEDSRVCVLLSTAEPLE